MKDIYQVLESLEIAFQKHEHPAAFTIEQAKQHWKNIDGAHCKNLFLRDYKGNRHFLVIIEGSKNFPIKTFQEIVGQRLSFASDQRLAKYLGLTAGSVSPFGLINDETKHVELFIDSDLKRYGKLNFHPNINTATLTISFAYFIKFLDWCGNKYSFFDMKA